MGLTEHEHGTLACVCLLPALYVGLVPVVGSVAALLAAAFDFL